MEFDPVSNITTIVAVPEPATFLLAAAGLAVVTVFKRRRHS